MEESDDSWMTSVGSLGWIIVGHDSRHHLREAELSAIRQFNMGCFYLWGTHAKSWEKLLCFLRAYPKMMDADRTTTRPYIFRISKLGVLRSVPILD